MKIMARTKATARRLPPAPPQGRKENKNILNRRERTILLNINIFFPQSEVAEV